MRTERSSALTMAFGSALVFLGQVGLGGCGANLPENGEVVAEDGDHPAFVRKMQDPASFDAELVNTEIATQSICGTNDLQYVNSYAGNLGQPVSFVRDHQRPVGAMESSASNTAGKFCSGTLIGADLFLTASHCIGNGAVGKYVAFNYERQANSTTLLPQEHFRVSAVVEDGGSKGVDYAILRLQGRPGDKYGFTRWATSDPAQGGTLTIIQHPSGRPKQVEIGKAGTLSGNYISYGDIDTEPGSSGSGVLNASGQVVGVHTLGGCSSTGGSNRGVRISKIKAVSQVIK